MTEEPIDPELLRASRRRLSLDTVGIAGSGVGEGLVYGLAAHAIGLSVVEVAAMSMFVFAGGAQFAALGYIALGAPWAAIVLITAFINSRHLLYGAALAPYLARFSVGRKAVMAFFLTDESFALSVNHFRRIGRTDAGGYWIAALGGGAIPWMGASILGAALASDIPEPARFGLDVIFPAAMAALAVGLVTERREAVAAVAGAIVGIAAALTWEAAAGIVVGGLVGPLVGLLIPAKTPTDPSAADASVAP